MDKYFYEEISKCNRMIDNIILEEIQKCHRSRLENLYTEESACILIFRIFPNCIQQMIMRYIYIDPVELKITKSHIITEFKIFNEEFREINYCTFLQHMKIISFNQNESKLIFFI